MFKPISHLLGRCATISRIPAFTFSKPVGRSDGGSAAAAGAATYRNPSKFEEREASQR